MGCIIVGYVNSLTFYLSVPKVEGLIMEYNEMSSSLNNLLWYPKFAVHIF